MDSHFLSGIYIYFAVLLAIYKGLAEAASVEFDLIHTLTRESNYNTNARPVASADDRVNLIIDLGFKQIIDLDEPTQILTTDIFLRLYWKDVSLVWEPAEYGNVTNVRIYAKRIWRPDLTLYNDVSTERRAVEKLYPVSVTYDGNVSWFSPVKFTSSCQLDMTYFPWDQQNCPLQLGSWSYDSSKIKTYNKSSSADTSVFVAHGEYDLSGVPAELSTEKFPCCVDPFESVVYTVKLTRKPMFYIFNLILPCVFISFVGLFAFVLPPNCGEKVSLSVTVLLASTVFLMIVAESVPPQSSTVPLVSRYFEAVIFMLALTSITTVFVINIHHRGEFYNRPPKFLRVVILDCLALLVLMRSQVRRNIKEHERKDGIPGVEKENTHGLNIRNAHIRDLSRQNSMNNPNRRKHKLEIQHSMDSQKNYNWETSERHRSVDSYPDHNADLSGKLLLDILNELKQQNGKMKETPSKTSSLSCVEWELVAMVLDRLFFICFLIACVVTTMAILIR